MWVALYLKFRGVLGFADGVMVLDVCLGAACGAAGDPYGGVVLMASSSRVGVGGGLGWGRSASGWGYAWGLVGGVRRSMGWLHVLGRLWCGGLRCIGASAGGGGVQ